MADAAPQAGEVTGAPASAWAQHAPAEATLKVEVTWLPRGPVPRSIRRRRRGNRRDFLICYRGYGPYNRARLSRDVVAGITLAALAIPDVMGYTKIAGTPVITGLYTILLPLVVFAFLGSSRHLVVGGDSATAAIMYAGIAGLGISGLQPNTPEWLAFASLSALITGVLLLLARLVRLGFLADFISRTVLVGFLTGVGIQVAAGEIGGMLSLPTPSVDLDVLSGTLVKLWDTLLEVGQTSVPTLAVSVGVLATLIVFERWIKAIPGGLVAVVGDRCQLGLRLAGPWRVGSGTGA